MASAVCHDYVRFPTKRPRAQFDVHQRRFAPRHKTPIALWRLGRSTEPVLSVALCLRVSVTGTPLHPRTVGRLQRGAQLIKREGFAQR